jgi:hypothetical protein
MELPADNFMSVLEKTDTLPMRSVDFGFSDVNNFSVFKELWIIVSGFNS